MLSACVTCVINFSLNDICYTVYCIQYSSTHEETLLPAWLEPQFDCMCVINRIEMIWSRPPLVCSPAGSCRFEMTWLESAREIDDGSANEGRVETHILLCVCVCV